MHEFWEFLTDVFWHWQSWLGGSGFGGAVVVFVALYERLTGHIMGKRMYVTIFVVAFLFGAFFMAWRDQHNQARELESQLSDMTGAGKLILDDLVFYVTHLEGTPSNNGGVQAGLKLKNNGPVLLKYEVKSLTVTVNDKKIGMNSDPTRFSNHGGYAYAETETTFFAPTADGIDISRSPVTGTIEYEITYHAVPTGPTRTTKKQLSYRFFLSNGQHPYIILGEEEK